MNKYTNAQQRKDLAKKEWDDKRPCKVYMGIAMAVCGAVWVGIGPEVMEAIRAWL